MGLGSRAEVAAFLLDRGWAAATPAALLLAASTPRAYSWTGPLGALGRCEVPGALADAPGTIVVGEVVALAAAAALAEAREGEARALTR
jgi:uroporphyrin-III C-methyltransferase